MQSLTNGLKSWREVFVARTPTLPQPNGDLALQTQFYFATIFFIVSRRKDIDFTFLNFVNWPQKWR